MWVLNDGPWSFDNAMLLISVIPLGEEPVKVQLWHLNIWIQIHELHAGFMSEIGGKQLGNFLGNFLNMIARIIRAFGGNVCVLKSSWMCVNLLRERRRTQEEMGLSL